MKRLNPILSVASIVLCLVITAVPFAAKPAAASSYQQHNLVSDLPGIADNQDLNLANPWGISSSATSPFWVSDNHTGVATLYNGSGQAQALVVTIPPPGGGSPPSAPTGQVFNATSDFNVGPNAPAHFIFATEDGTISGWNSGTAAVLAVDNSAAGAVYKGLAIGNNGSINLLYAANFHAGTIDVFGPTFAPVGLSGSFTDPTIPAGFAPFNIQNLGGKLYVTYAKQDGTKHDDVPGPGNGFVDVYDTNGNLLNRLITNGVLNSPWGLALSPATFGTFSNALLVGNFGNGRINAFDPVTGSLLGTLEDTNNSPIVNEGLWGLKFGNGGNGFDPDKLYFTAGIPGNGMVEDHGLFGSIEVVPGPATFFSTGDPDGKMGTGSRPAGSGKIEIESADDFLLSSTTSITAATFTGLLTGGVPLSSIGEVAVEIYRIFPQDSTDPPSGNVPTRVNSPSDVALDSRDSVAGTLSFSTTILNSSFTVANTVLNGINKIPNQTTGGEGPATGTEVLFTVHFSTPFLLPAGHYFFIPQVEVKAANGEFLWLSAPKPIVTPGTPFTPDLQTWIRNENLDPDWLRVGTDIIGGSPAPTFNAAFSLIGVTIPAVAGESPYVAIVGNDALEYKVFYFSPKHSQFLFDQSPTGIAQAAPVCFGAVPSVTQYTRVGTAGCEQFRSQTLNNQAEVCDTTGTGTAPNFRTRGLPTAVTRAGNSGFYEWWIRVPQKPSGQINLVIECGVLKPNSFAAYHFGAIELCAGEAGERVGYGTCARQEVDPGVSPVIQAALPKITAIVYPGPNNVAFAPFHLTAFKNPSAYTLVFDAVTFAMSNNGNSQVLDGSGNTRILLKACMDKTVVTKLPVTGQINALCETETDLEADDLIQVRMDIPRQNTVDIYCHAQSARLAGIGEGF